MERITVRFEIDAPGTNRHRVSVWDDEGALLSPPSADLPLELAVHDGETIWVEASVPSSATGSKRANRDEKRWELRAASDAHAVLNVGRKGKNGFGGTLMEIRVDGASQARGPKAHS